MTFIGGASHGKSRNGEAERVANRVRRESVDAGASLEYCKQPPAGANAAETPPRKGSAEASASWRGRFADLENERKTTMTKAEIETDIAEVIRDLADIARRAHIAAANFGEVRAAQTPDGTLALPTPARCLITVYLDHIERIESEANLTRKTVERFLEAVRENGFGDGTDAQAEGGEQ